MNEGTKSPRAYTRAVAINIAIALAALSTGTESLSSLLRFLHDDRGCEPESQSGRVANHIGQLETGPVTVLCRSSDHILCSKGDEP
jgi:hypothetical protein